VTREEFLNLKPGDKIIGRSHGEGKVHSTSYKGTSNGCIVRWNKNGVATFPLNMLSTMWKNWNQSPMASWIKLTE